MSLKIATQQNFSEGLKEKIKEQCTQSLQFIKAKAKTDPHEVIHETRKSLKKNRAILRLVRDQIDFYKEENAFFRDEGRRIADLRDATSVIEALDQLYERFTDQLYEKTFDQYRKHLISRRDQKASDSIGDKGVLKTLEQQLTEKCAELDQWTFGVESIDDLLPSIKRVYKRGRKGYKKTRENPNSANFHEWRKRVKYLRYQLDLLNRIWPNFLDTWEDELHDLSDLLGDDRDLYMLAELVEKDKDQFADRESYELMHSLINFRRSALQDDALSLGKRLYLLEKETFAAWIKTSWEAFEE
ncbi:MAG TPA: CHAD domain-containing protein [Cryomorphaceae bacterium]|nr:CHAD domain-containing protein [Cryomorphaceae bacterium]